MKAGILATLALLPLAGGCAALNTRAISYPPGHGSQLFVWGSQYSAGIGQQNGMCAQAATTARTTGVSAEATVNNSVMAALVPALAAMDQGEAARVAGGLTQSVMLTNATNGQTAYANIAYFYLCQISLNRNLAPQEIMQMWRDVTETVPLVGTAGITTSTISSQAPSVPQRPSDENSTSTPGSTSLPQVPVTGTGGTGVNNDDDGEGE